MAQVAMAWVLAKPTVASVVFGATTMEQLNENIKATSITLSPEQVSQDTS